MILERELAIAEARRIVAAAANNLQIRRLGSGDAEETLQIALALREAVSDIGDILAPTRRQN